MGTLVRETSRDMANSRRKIKLVPGVVAHHKTGARRILNSRATRASEVRRPAWAP